AKIRQRKPPYLAPARKAARHRPIPLDPPIWALIVSKARHNPDPWPPRPKAAPAPTTCPPRGEYTLPTPSPPSFLDDFLPNCTILGAIPLGIGIALETQPERTLPMAVAVEPKPETLRALPGDDVRQIQWRFANRYDLQMLVQSTRAVAGGPVARLVAEGARNTHAWTPAKQRLLEHFDASGITGVFLDPEQGGLVEGPKNLALALVAFELAWVDAGAATGSLAGCLALSPIHERGTPKQRETYMRLCAPAQPGSNRQPWRGAFCLTEPIPYVGVETGILAGKVRVVDWVEGREPTLQVEKRGRFITNMGFANF